MHRYVVLAAVICLMHCGIVNAQSPEPPHAQVVAYDDEAAIEKLAYQSSPYYMELSGTWRMSQTDSSVVYTQLLSADKSWKDYHTYLFVRCGHGCRVYLNHKLVGMGADSRQWSEFLLDKYLKYGKNCILEIEALKTSQGALLDDPRTDVAINGTPYLLFKSDPCIADFSVNADYDAVAKRGSFNAQVELTNDRGKGRYYLEAEIKNPRGQHHDRMGKWVIFDGENTATVELNRAWTNIEPWSAETPILYTIVFRLYNEDMQQEETTGTKVGFRRVEVKDGLLTINNKPIKLKGVVYGVEATEEEATRIQMQQDLETMKRHNINAIRTAGFSPVSPYFYELCDRYGIYVVCDANLHPTSTLHKAIATDSKYITMFEDRVKNMYETYKNHASIVAWSLGDSRDNGVCMTAAYKLLKREEKRRPVVFSGAGIGGNTDITALLSPSGALINSTIAKMPNRPLIMLKSVNAEHIGELAQLWTGAMNMRQFQGGFADIWPADRAVMTELRNVYRNVDVSVDKISIDEGSFWVANNSDFANLANYGLEYTIFTSFRPNIISGDLPIAAAAGERCKVGMRIPPIDIAAGEELFIRFDVRKKAKHAATQFQDGKETFTFQLPQRTKRKKVFTNANATLTLQDTNLITFPRLHFVGNEQWNAVKVLDIAYLSDSNVLSRECMLRYSKQNKNMCDVHLIGTLYATGDLVLNYTINAVDSVQPALTFDWSCDTIKWFGQEQSLHAIPTKSDVIGLFNSQLDVPISRKQVSWCTAVQGLNTTLLHIIDGKFSLDADKNSLTVLPNRNTKFSLHIRPQVDNQFTSLLSIDYPTPVSRIPTAPIITASEGTAANPIQVSITSSKPCTIRYTIDGSDPDENSPEYTQPITIDQTAIVKARAYTADSFPSLTVMRKISYNYISSTTFSKSPSTPYNVGADTLLFDRQIGSIDNLSDGWVGFSGEGVVTTVAFTKSLTVEYVKLRYAHSPSTWAFAPQTVSISYSTDGVHFENDISVPIPINPSDKNSSTPQVVEIVVPIDQHELRSIRVNAQSIDSIPQWHRAKGLKPWLLMDEIEVVGSSSK